MLLARFRLLFHNYFLIIRFPLSSMSGDLSVYHPRQIPRFGSLYLISRCVILFPPFPSPLPVLAFCSIRNSFEPVHPSQATATCPYGLLGVLLRKTMSPSFGTAVTVFTTLSHFVHMNGLPVSQPLSADPQNVQIGFHISFACCRAKSTHWYQYTLS